MSGKNARRSLGAVYQWFFLDLKQSGRLSLEIPGLTPEETFTAPLETRKISTRLREGFSHINILKSLTLEFPTHETGRGSSQVRLYTIKFYTQFLFKVPINFLEFLSTGGSIISYPNSIDGSSKILFP